MAEDLLLEPFFLKVKPRSVKILKDSQILMFRKNTIDIFTHDWIIFLTKCLSSKKPKIEICRSGPWPTMPFFPIIYTFMAKF